MSASIELTEKGGFAILITGIRLSGKSTLGERLFNDLATEISARQIPIILVTGDDLRNPKPLRPKKYVNTNLLVGGDPIPVPQNNEDRGGPRLRQVLEPIVAFVNTGGIAICDLFFPTIRQRQVFHELFPRLISVHLHVPYDVWVERRKKSKYAEGMVLKQEELRALDQEFAELTANYESPIGTNEPNAQPHLVIDSSDTMVSEESITVIKALLSDDFGYLRRVHTSKTQSTIPPESAQNLSSVATARDVYSLLRDLRLDKVELIEEKGWVKIEETKFGGTQINMLIDLVKDEDPGRIICHLRCYLPIYPYEDKYPEVLSRLLRSSAGGAHDPHFAQDSDGQLICIFNFSLASSGFNHEEFKRQFIARLQILLGHIPQLMVRMYGGMLPNTESVLKELSTVNKNFVEEYQEALRLKSMLDKLTEEERERVVKELVQLGAKEPEL